MNTRIYRNSYEQPKGGYQTNKWGDEGQTSSVRSSTPMDRARTRAMRYSAVVIIVMLSLAITFTTIALNGNPKKKNNNTDPVAVPIAFAVPVSGEFEITRYYADDKLQWNETAEQWQGFRAVNLQAELGTTIVATYSGTVSEVSSDSMCGTVVKIQHKDGLMTVYSGLDKELLVKKGDAVEKGQAIGKFGDTLALEKKDGPTLRVEVYKDGKKVNPADYIAFGENK